MTQSRGVLVRVKFVTSRQLKQAWVRDLSKNTLFVRTEAPLPLGERVLLRLELPDGESLEVGGEVAQVVTGETATPMRPAGMAVQMHNFEGPKRSRIEEYLRRHRTVRPGSATQPLRAVSTPPPRPAPAPAMETLVQSLRRLLWLCADPDRLREVDHYQALGLSPTASVDEIREACAAVRLLLDPGSPPDGLERLTGGQKARLAALHAALGEIEQTLVDPERRARYDAENFDILR